MPHFSPLHHCCLWLPLLTQGFNTILIHSTSPACDGILHAGSGCLHSHWAFPAPSGHRGFPYSRFFESLLWAWLFRSLATTAGQCTIRHNFPSTSTCHHRLPPQLRFFRILAAALLRTCRPSFASQWSWLFFLLPSIRWPNDSLPYLAVNRDAPSILLLFILPLRCPLPCQMPTRILRLTCNVNLQ